MIACSGSVCIDPTSVIVTGRQMIMNIHRTVSEMSLLVSVSTAAYMR